MTHIQKDDLVCYTAKFLRAVSWYTDVPIDGKVIDASDHEFPVVQWCDRDDPVRVNKNNLILKKDLHKEPA